MSDKSVSILHVEDDSTDALLMQELLMNDIGASKFDVVHVGCLRRALSQLRNRGYDAVLLDLNLPDANGLENVRAIKDQNPDIPVVVLSGMDDDGLALKAVDAGAQEYIVKGHGNGKVIRLAIHSSIKRKALERRLFKQANYDELTGLSNRRHFQDYMELALARAKRAGRHEVLMFMDIDNFKKINDTHGHSVGNEVIREAAERIKRTLRASDFICRYGGDEFLVLLDGNSEDMKYTSGEVATKLLYAFSEPFKIDGKEIEFFSSIGIACFPEAGEDFTTLLKQADKAMYEAKKAGGHQFRYAAMGGSVHAGSQVAGMAAQSRPTA